VIGAAATADDAEIDPPLQLSVVVGKAGDVAPSWRRESGVGLQDEASAGVFQRLKSIEIGNVPVSALCW
jgi:hypothetical protein